MSVALTILEAVKRLRSRDPTLKYIELTNKQCTDLELLELIDCLLTNPHGIRGVYLGTNQLTDETGIKLAHFLKLSSTIEWLTMEHNQFGKATYLAIASALHINTSLCRLYLHQNLIVDNSRIDMAFIDALILNPNRPIDSWWYLYSWKWTDFRRLKEQAEELGHPSMLATLAMQHIKVF